MTLVVTVDITMFSRLPLRILGIFAQLQVSVGTRAEFYGERDPQRSNQHVGIKSRFGRYF